MTAVVLELNGPFAADALALPSPLKTPAAFGLAQANPSRVASFSELLASAQSEPAAVNEEAVATPVMPALPGRYSQPSAASVAFQEGSAVSHWDYSSPPHQPEEQPDRQKAASESNPDTAATATHKDATHKDMDDSSRESSRLSGPGGSAGARPPTGRDTALPEHAAATAVTNGKTAEKPKQHKSGTGGELTETAVASASVAAGDATTPTDPAAGAANPNRAATLQDGEPSPALTPKARNAKSGDPDNPLAFAVRIQGMNSASAGGLLSQPNAAAAAEAANPEAQLAVSPFAAELAGMLPVNSSKLVLQELGLRADGSAATAGLSELAAAASAGADSAATGALASNTRQAPAAEEAAAVPTPADEPLAGSQPVKTVQIQITGADDQRLDLKLMEKSGALSISVRSSDGPLTKALQQNLPDLTSKLNDQQIRAEWWRPEVKPTELAAQSAKSSGRGESDNAASQDRGNQNSGNQNQRHSGQQQPDWLDELSAPHKSNQNGTQYSWQL